MKNQYQSALSQLQIIIERNTRWHVRDAANTETAHYANVPHVCGHTCAGVYVSDDRSCVSVEMKLTLNGSMACLWPLLPVCTLSSRTL